MKQEKRNYEAPSTKLVRVEMEGSICTGSQPGHPVNGDDGSRHVNINPQEDGGTIDFTKGEDNTWD